MSRGTIRLTPRNSVICSLNQLLVTSFHYFRIISEIELPFTEALICPKIISVNRTTVKKGNTLNFISSLSISVLHPRYCEFFFFSLSRSVLCLSRYEKKTFRLIMKRLILLIKGTGDRKVERMKTNETTR